MRVDRNIYSAIQKYEEMLAQLETATSPAEQVLPVLLARDAVQDVLQKVECPPISLLLYLSELDKRLREQQAIITGASDYSHWRDSFQPPDSSWWWYFSESIPLWWQVLNQSCNFLTLAFLTFSVSLIADAVPRFLSGGFDTISVLAVIIPSLLTLLTSGALTPIGREFRNYLFQKLAKSYWSLVTMAIALILLVLLIFAHNSFPEIAVYFHDRGEKQYLAGRLEESLGNYQKAIALNPSYAEAHYNLGLVYEDLQQFPQAQTEYQLAVQQDVSATLLTRLKAYNNWGRLLILQKKYTQAIAPLLEGKNALNEEQVTTNNDFQQVKYALLKNLGWAQLELKHYSEAKSLLKEAIDLDSNKAPAYCLLAQVFEGQSQKQEASDNWQKCIAYADANSPDEYLWKSIAQEKLEKEKKP
ncbi:MAG: tetratricopeptide repeat protein [Xenococcaceae cyanobacterium MO_188.B29]|nr:tetratricopeptide repeat protein [Xenococcaceae cyanobacterium MO_188.B29]